MNLARLLNKTARVHATRTALLDAEMTLTWSQWFDRIRRVAGMLADRARARARATDC